MYLAAPAVFIMCTSASSSDRFLHHQSSAPLHLTTKYAPHTMTPASIHCIMRPDHAAAALLPTNTDVALPRTPAPSSSLLSYHKTHDTLNYNFEPLHLVEEAQKTPKIPKTLIGATNTEFDFIWSSCSRGKINSFKDQCLRQEKSFPSRLITKRLTENAILLNYGPFNLEKCFSNYAHFMRRTWKV